MVSKNFGNCFSIFCFFDCPFYIKRKNSNMGNGMGGCVKLMKINKRELALFDQNRYELFSSHCKILNKSIQTQIKSYLFENYSVFE